MPDWTLEGWLYNPPVEQSRSVPIEISTFRFPVEGRLTQPSRGYIFLRRVFEM